MVFAEVTGSNRVEALKFFQGSSPQLFKLVSLFLSAVQNNFIYIVILKECGGVINEVPL